jgi:DNA polymerase
MTFFDRFAAIRLGWMRCDDHAYVDTSELARLQGFPGALDALAMRKLGRNKDKAASKFTVSLSTVRRPSGKNNPDAIASEIWNAYSKQERRERGVLPELTPDKLAHVDVYNLDDVEILAHTWPDLAEWLDVEPDVIAVDRIINDRGIMFDGDLAAALLECDARNGDAAMTAIAKEIGWAPAALRKAVNSDTDFPRYTGLPNAQAQTVDEALDAPQPWRNALTAPFCRARQAIASIERGKLRAGLDRVSDDGRLRDMMRIYGAHTGRWSGMGMQLHNLPKPIKTYEKWTDDDICRLADAVRSRRHEASQAEITLLVRACLTCGPDEMLAACDYSGVEARVAAWVAGDERALDVFRSGRDPYKAEAAPIFGVSYDAVDDDQRGIGKRAVLGCGYGAGGDAIRRMAKKEAGIDIDAALARMGGTIGDADELVAAWRANHKPIVQLWYRLNDAFTAAACGEDCDVGPFAFRPSSDGKDVALFMPTGRAIVYNDVRVKQVVKEGRRGPYKAIECSYMGTKFREHVYGGMLCENAVQSLCRELLAGALVKAEAAGLSPVLHVHDDGVVVVPRQAAREGYEYWRGIMLDVPEWIGDCPLDAKGFTGKRLRK